MSGRTAKQQATVTLMIEIAAGMAEQTQRIARSDVVDVGEVELTHEEDTRLGDALAHIEQASYDLRRLRGGN